jgi:hypothetical protein
MLRNRRTPFVAWLGAHFLFEFNNNILETLLSQKH